MNVIPTPTQIARRADRNTAKVGDSIVYRSTVGLEERMLVEEILPATDPTAVVYRGAGNRVIVSRRVLKVEHKR